MSFKNATIKAIAANSEEYHKHNTPRGIREFPISSSSLRAFWSCPSKWREPITDEDGVVSYWEFPGSKSTEWGNLFDCLLLTPEQFEARYAVTPPTYPCEPTKKDPRTEKPWNGNATYCQEWKAEQEAAGREPVSSKDVWWARQAIKRFLRDEQLGAFIAESDKQVWVTAEWHDEPTGLVIPCKCLIDVAPRQESQFAKCLADVKTTKNGRPIPWEKWCHAVGYEVQAAWNTDLFVAATQREITSFCFLLSENTAPYEIGRRMMSQDLFDQAADEGDIASGRRQYVQMLHDYCQCLKTNRWPGYDDHDESVMGWTLVRPNPYAEQARLFAPKYNLDAEEDGEEAPETSDPLAC